MRFLFGEETKGFCFSALRDYHTTVQSAYASSPPAAPTMLVILASRSRTECFQLEYHAMPKLDDIAYGVLLLCFLPWNIKELLTFQCSEKLRCGIQYSDSEYLARKSHVYECRGIFLR